MTDIVKIVPCPKLRLRVVINASSFFLDLIRGRGSARPINAHGWSCNVLGMKSMSSIRLR